MIFIGNEVVGTGEKIIKNRGVYLFVLGKISDAEFGLCEQMNKIFIVTLLIKIQLALNLFFRTFHASVFQLIKSVLMQISKSPYVFLYLYKDNALKISHS